MNKNGNNVFGLIFNRNHFSTKFQFNRKPADIIVKSKVEPINAPNFKAKPQIIESFYSGFINQPRSKLKLPVKDLIRPHNEVNINTESNGLEVKSKADLMLERLVSKDTSELIPRLQLINEITKEFAIEGNWEKAESLISNMKTDFGVEPSYDTLGFLALAYLNGGKRGTSVKCLSKIPEWGQVPQTIYKSLISEALKTGNSEKAENLYSIIRGKCLPSPELTGLILMNYGKTDRIELGMKLYNELVGSGMEPNPVTHSAIIYLCSRSKRHFETAVTFYEQMKLLQFPIHLRVHNYMLQGCAKVSDLDRAMSIWNGLLESSISDSRLKPNEFTLSSILWTLASVETAETKLSKRQFHYEMNRNELLSLAGDIYRRGILIIKPNSHLANGYLAVLTDNVSIAEAENFFHNEMTSDNNCKRTEHSYELMFKMYDGLRDFERTRELKEKMNLENLIVPFEGWRAMIRTAALNNDIETSLSWLKEMTENGYKPSIEDLKVVKLRICELKKFDFMPKFEALCIPEPKPIKRVVGAWRERSKILDKFFKSVYGDDAPKLSTNVE